MNIDINNLDKRTKAILFGLFLSKYDLEALELLRCSSFRKAYERIGKRLGVSPNSIQIHRNKFDTFFPNKRKGFLYNKEKGQLKDYEEWVKRTKEWPSEQFWNVLMSFMEDQEDNDLSLTQAFERLSKEFDRAFEKMFLNCDQIIFRKLSLLERDYDIVNSEDYEQSFKDSRMEFVEAFLAGLDEVFEQNGEKYFRKYKSICLKLYDFIREHWNKENLQHLKNIDSRWIDNYYNFYENYFYNSDNDYQRRALSNLRCDSMNMICSYYIIDHLRDAFSLTCLQDDLYKLQRFLVNLAIGSLKKESLDILRAHTKRFHEVTHALNENVDIEFKYFLVEPLPTKSYLRKPLSIVAKPTKKVKEGALYAELAYYLFKANKRKRSSCIKSYSLIIDNKKYLISGKFEFPCKLSGFLAESKSGAIVLGFKGSTCGNHWTTNRLQFFIGPETSYLCALGLLLELRKHVSPNENIHVYGHSLGGGLSQFAVAAVTALGFKNVYGYCYNSAGLRKTSMSVIYSINPRFYLKNISHLFHQSDYVHTKGYLLGRRYFIGPNYKILNLLVVPLWYFHRIETIISILGLKNSKMELI